MSVFPKAGHVGRCKIPLLPPTTSATLLSGERTGREGACPPSKWGRKAAKLKELEKEQWAPSEKVC